MSKGEVKRPDDRRVKHGMKGHDLYVTWKQMRRRCYSPKSDAFKNYGARGIKVCERWLESFPDFVKDMGDRPKGATLDRIDNDGPYSPGNCRWATRSQQARNTRTSSMLEAFGEEKSIHEWADECGILASTIQSRIAYGWDAERSISTPATAFNNSKYQMYEFGGETLSLSAIARRAGVDRNALRRRVVEKGMDLHDAIGDIMARIAQA